MSLLFFSFYSFRISRQLLQPIHLAIILSSYTCVQWVSVLRSCFVLAGSFKSYCQLAINYLKGSGIARCVIAFQRYYTQIAAADIAYSAAENDGNVMLTVPTTSMFQTNRQLRVDASHVATAYNAEDVWFMMISNPNIFRDDRVWCATLQTYARYLQQHRMTLQQHDRHLLCNLE